METGSTANCTCIGCSGGKKRSKPKPSGIRPSQNIGRPRAVAKQSKPPTSVVLSSTVQTETPLRHNNYPRNEPRSTTPDHERVDEEGTPDVYRQLVAKLSDRLILDIPIDEPKSFDWQINRRNIHDFFEDLSTQPAFQPRLGELVLFVRGLTTDQVITFDKTKRSFVIWDTAQEVLLEMPQWEAGVITEVPQETITVADLVIEQRKQHQINYSGFRIEPMSPINSEDKHWSKRVAQVRLDQIRPLVLYRDVLKGIRPPDWHATIGHALTTMSSFSLCERFHFKGHWPDAVVFCRGIFVGAELLTVGDTIRLMPGSVASDPQQVWDVMKITAIKLRMIHLDARDNPDYNDPTKTNDTGREYDCCVHIDGIGFTRDQSRAWGIGKLPINEHNEILPANLKGYGNWYHLHDPKKRWKVPFSKILGRCFEEVAMKLWFSSAENAPKYSQGFSAINAPEGVPDSVIPAEAVDISKGLKDMVSARNFSRQRDTRIKAYREGKTWYWADHRAEQLELQEVKGQALAAFVHGRPTRDIQAWRRAMAIREKGAGHRAKPEITGYDANRLSNLSGGSLLAASAVGAAVGEAEAEAAAAEGTEGTGDETSPSDGVEEVSADNAMDLDLEPKQEETAVIDPNQIQISSDKENSEMESEEEEEEKEDAFGLQDS